MDITGGTQNSGGFYSPSNAKRGRFNETQTLYDPKFHRWMKQ